MVLDATTRTIIDATKHSIASAGHQADLYDETTKAIREYLGNEYGYKMMVLVLQGKETMPT